MSWLSSLAQAVASLFRPRKATAPAPRMVVGVNVHRLTLDDVALLKRMGVRHLRISLYANGDGWEWIDRAILAGFEVLVCSYRDERDRGFDRMRCFKAVFQYGNEPETKTFYAAREVALATGGEVSPGFRNETPASALAEYSALASRDQILAIHVYGDSLPDAATNRLAAVKGLNRRVWVTEIGKVGGDDFDLAVALGRLQAAGVERTYVYALWSPDDGYTLTPGQQVTITAWNRGAA